MANLTENQCIGMVDQEEESCSYLVPEIDVRDENVELDLPSLDNNHSAPDGKQETVYFNDGVRKIDFVLAYDAEKDYNPSIRQTFEENLMREGLELELVPACESYDGKTAFLKVHAPWHVLSKSAEAASLQMPMIENYIEIAQRKKKFHTKTRGGLYNLQPCWSDINEMVLRLFDWIRSNILQSDEMETITPYYMAPYNDVRNEHFLIENKATFFKNIQRIFIVREILRRTSFDDNEATGNVGIYKLLNMKVFTAAFPLHDGPVDVHPFDYTVDVSVIDNTRMHLLVNWANPTRWYKYQPLDNIREYLGDHIGLYFCFLGFYTTYLSVPAIVGVLVFIFGIVTQKRLDTPTEEICNELGPTVMCPTCDQTCDYWRLSGSCLFSRLTYLFDNYSTIILSIVSCVWANIFLVFWERQQNTLRFHWDMENYEDAEQVRPEFEISAETFRVNAVTKKIEPYMTTGEKVKKTVVSFSVVVLLLTLACSTAVGVITYRIAVTQYYGSVDDQPLINEYARLMAAASGSLINLVVISILDIVYFYLAQKLTAWENHRTETEHEHSLTFKLFLFQCVNYYSAIIYIAMFKGKVTGRPGEYNRIFGLRSEECDVAGCFIEFAIMCMTVMLGKQLFAIFYELALYPFVLSPLWLRYYTASLNCSAFRGWLRDQKVKLGRFFKRNKIGDEYVSLKPESKPTTRWEKDYMLEPLPEYGLLYEYLELAIQYGFVTLFVVGFPLAPLFALINNVIEIQIDSYKVLVNRRRTYLVRAHGIGIWFTIFKVISKLSIFVNAVIIAWTSDIINKLLFIIGYCNHGDGIGSNHLEAVCSKMWDGPSVKATHIIRDPSQVLRGYVRYSLSKFDTNDWEPMSIPSNNGTNLFGEPVEFCFYKDFRHGPSSEAKYARTKEFWHSLATKLAFIVCFEQTMILITSLVSLLIPAQCKLIESQRKRAKFLANGSLQDLEKERSRLNLNQKKRAALNRINFN